MTTSDPLLTNLFEQEIAAKRETLARLELAALDRRIAALESMPVASTKEPPPRRWYLRKRWLLAAIFAALLLFGGLSQRATVGSLIDRYVAPAHVQVGSQRIDTHAIATAAVEVKGRILATIVPTAPELPQATPIPTIGTGATVPQEEAPTPVAAQEPAPPEPPQDVQPGNMPVQPAPAVEAPAQPATPVEAPAQPAQPTAAPTSEPQGEVVAVSQDAPVQANGEPLIDWSTEAAKAQAAQRALEFTKQWQGVKP